MLLFDSRDCGDGSWWRRLVVERVKFALHSGSTKIPAGIVVASTGCRR